MINDTDSRVKEFQERLVENAPNYIVQRDIIFGSCAVIDNDQYLSLRSEVAKKFRVHPNDVLVVGSAKLGFSIAPHKRYRHFGDESDIDVVIVKSELFDDVWHSVYKAWMSKVYWPDEFNFQKYLFRGWIRPDYFPATPSVKIAKDWWEYFRSLTYSRSYGPYKLSGAIYKSWDYVEQYQMGAITQCKESLEQMYENKCD